MRAEALTCHEFESVSGSAIGSQEEKRFSEHDVRLQIADIMLRGASDNLQTSDYAICQSCD
jgi:hypothetical protein